MEREGLWYFGLYLAMLANMPRFPQNRSRWNEKLFSTGTLGINIKFAELAIWHNEGLTTGMSWYDSGDGHLALVQIKPYWDRDEPSLRLQMDVVGEQVPVESSW